MGWPARLFRRDRRAPKGAIVTKDIRCDGVGCRCGQPGDAGHGPSRYRVWREGGRVRTAYLGKAEIDPTDA